MIPTICYTGAFIYPSENILESSSGGSAVRQLFSLGNTTMLHIKKCLSNYLTIQIYLFYKNEWKLEGW